MRQRVWLLVLAFAMCVTTAKAPAQPRDIFSFHSNAWLNLHHFIRSHARGAPLKAPLSDDERQIWAAGVELYRPYAKRDVLFDEGMVAIKGALRQAGGRRSLVGIAIDRDLAAALERVMSVYEKHWWPDHDRANREWIAAARPLVEKHGPALSQAVARAYGVAWPSAPIPVDVSVIAGPVGAYTTDNPTHVTISSVDEGYRGYNALEMLFHESSHGFDVLYNGVARAAREHAVLVPQGLWHGILFFTAGELTRRELARHGVEYAEYGNGSLYSNLCGPGCRERIAEHWTPRLDGEATVAASLDAVVRSFAVMPRSDH
jgi:hypothetical protein